MSRYTAKDDHVASKEERALVDYIAQRWNGDYQLRAAVDGTGYHLCTRSACCQFNNLSDLKQFLGEQRPN